MIRVWVGVALAVALLAGGWAGYRAAYAAGAEAGRAVVRAEWDADRVRQAEGRSEALRAAGEALAAEMARREEAERELSIKLAAADARGRDLSGRLRRALAEAGPCPVPAGRAAGSSDAAPGIPGDPSGVGEALAGHLAACERDAERLSQLQRWARVISIPTQ